MQKVDAYVHLAILCGGLLLAGVMNSILIAFAVLIIFIVIPNDVISRLDKKNRSFKN